MKNTKTTIKELTAQYRAVLRKCLFLNAAILLGAMIATPAVATDGVSQFITTDQTITGETVSGLTYTSSNAVRAANKDYGGYAFIDRGVTVTVNNSTFNRLSFDGTGTVFVTRTTSLPNKATLNISNSSRFDGNETAREGGAIANYSVLNVSSSSFEGNLSLSGPFDSSNSSHTSTEVGGGAIALGSSSETTISNSTFTENRAEANGGAIKTKSGVMDVAQYNDGLATRKNDNSGATLDISVSTFTGNNSGLWGGALYNSFYNSNANPGYVRVLGTRFMENYAKNGGAIYNDGRADKLGNGGKIKIDGSTFTGNNVAVGDYASSTYKRQGVGGAISASGIVDVSASTFNNNTALSTGTGYGLGGAIATNTIDGVASTVSIEGSDFTNNKAESGGAVYGMLKTAGLSTITVADSTFTNNEARYSGGAIANFDKLTIDGATFNTNKVTTDIASEVDGGGALFVGSSSVTEIKNGTSFVGNTSMINGGAIATRANDASYAAGSGNNADATLTITNTEFTSNVATGNGGAIINFFHKGKNNADFVEISNTTFSSNQAANGGAIYNAGTGSKDPISGKIALQDTSFSGNIATTAGGAIYNEINGVVSLAGTNTFTGNKANNVGNDIHNLGAVRIVSGTTTIDGGITGTGALYIADGATLDIGTTKVTQDEITLASGSTLKAVLTSTTSYGALSAGTINAAGATLSLNIANAGTYDILHGYAGELNALTLDVGTLYNLTKNADGTIEVATKSTDQIINDNPDLSPDAGNALGGLTQNDSDLANQLVIQAQELLTTGGATQVNEEMKKLNPDATNSAGTVASGVQNQLGGITGGRMGGVGRSGGDVKADYGMWAQGLYNKSKRDGSFRGYTQGVALGFDTVLNGTYTIGLGYAYSATDIKPTGRKTQAYGDNFFVYGQYKPTRWYVNGMFNYSTSDYKEKKSVLGVGLNADYDVDTFGGQVMTGYDFAFGLTPEVGARYIFVKDYTYFDGVSDIKVKSNDVLTAVAGLKYAKSFGKKVAFEPSVSARATYDVISDNGSSVVTMAGATPYSVSGERLARFGAEFGAGLTASYGNTDLSLNYDIGVRRDYTSQTGTLKLKYNF